MIENIPLISVIMSVYNTEIVFLKEAIDSILNQTFSNFEFIIIDDCSGEETQKILNEYKKDNRVILKRNEKNLGLTVSLNRAISLARGKYLARMDADDICFPQRFEVEIEYLEKFSDLGVVGTSFVIMDNGREIFRGNEAYFPEQIKARLFFCNNGLLHSSVLMRRELICKELDLLYNEEIKKSQDFDLWVRVSRKSKIFVIPIYLMKYRVSNNQISTKNKSEQIMYRKQIIRSQLFELIPETDKIMEKLHLQLCNGDAVDSIIKLMQWTDRLNMENKKYNMFDENSFKYYLSVFAMRSAKKSLQRFQLCDYCNFFRIILEFCVNAIHFNLKNKKDRKKRYYL